jgi:hypothetical protein
MNEVEAASELGFEVMNHSGFSTDLIVQNTEVRELARTLSSWVTNARAATGRTSMFDRGAFTPPENVYDEMRAARTAVQFDDIVSGVAEITEAFAFQGITWESESMEESDIFNQIAADLDLDSVVRRAWREEYTYGQVVLGSVWGWKEYTVRGRNPLPKEKTVDPFTGKDKWVAGDPYDAQGNRKQGVKRRKKYRVWCPISMRTIDPTKVVPLGMGPMGQQLLAWQATEWEIGYFNAVNSGEVIDSTYSTMFLGRYTPGYDEDKELAALGVDTKRLLVMNPNVTFRHTTTKADYARFADIRLKSCFTLLDMKRQLLASDRAALVGSANYILLVRKGSKDEPAMPEELENLKQNYSFIAKMPVIISDHRLTIDIIAPKIDLTLQQEKYDVLDTRLMARLLGTLSLGSRGQRNETNVTISYALARNMENRRHMLSRSLEREIGKAVVEHPNNAGVFEESPSLVYTPRNITLGFDAALVQAILALRTQREISRETILEYFSLDQSTEAMRLEMEQEMYDDIFKTSVPFNSPANQPGNQPGELPGNQPGGKPQDTPNGTPPASQVTGGQGGRPVGGGAAPKNATKATPKTGSGNTATTKETK